MRFFGGNLDDWFKLEAPTIAQALGVMEKLRARETLTDINIAHFDTIKKSERDRWMRELQRAAVDESQKRALRPEDFARLMGAKDGRR